MNIEDTMNPTKQMIYEPVEIFFLLKNLKIFYKNICSIFNTMEIWCILRDYLLYKHRLGNISVTSTW